MVQVIRGSEVKSSDRRSKVTRYERNVKNKKKNAAVI
jgi:hypothetical protein